MSSSLSESNDVAAVIVAAGHGSRFGGSVPKQYQELLGRPVIAWTLDRVIGHPRVDLGILVVADPYIATMRELVGTRPVEVISGADNRQQSVALGLEALAETAPRIVLVHDGVRPNVTEETIGGVIDALDDADGAIATVPVVDTIKRDGRDGKLETVDRTALYRAQTPQGFRYRKLLEAYRTATQEFTDDAALAAEHGLNVALVEGSDDNMKITRSTDLQRMERLLATGETRVGFGYDVHRFGPGDHVMLCGVRIEHGSSLVGHSDADVALHALTDALLGAIGLGDIGTHFPPSDPQWRGAASDQFLTYARDQVLERGYAVANVDVTLVCEAPKIGPHRAVMIKRLSDLLGTEEARISVKATTSEGLGFTGRGEGIACQAVASIVGVG